MTTSMSRKDRIFAAVFVPLSVLFLVLTIVYGGPKEWIWPTIMLGMSMMLFTRFSWVFFPSYFLIFGSTMLYEGINRTDLSDIGVGIVLLLMGFLYGGEKLLGQKER